jgi:hypothetical protein
MNQFIQQNNQRGVIKSLVQKALTSAAARGEALTPESLEQLITNAVVRLSPELAMVSPIGIAAKYHSFNRMTTLPSPGGAIGEGATTPTRFSRYERAVRELKVIRRKGAVTNFLQDASREYIDAAAVEMENHLVAHVNDMVTYLVHGNDLADQYQFPGWDRFIATNRINEAVGGVVPTTLGFLDNMIDLNTERQGAGHRKAFLMSPQMLSKVSALLTNVRLNQGLTAGGLTQVDVNGGWRLNAYRDIPIIQSAQTRPKVANFAVATATATTGGALPATTPYYFRVSKVTWDGESLPSAQVTRTTGASVNTHTITLSWTAQADAVLYKIYAGTSTGDLKLHSVIPAFTYDADGTPTGSVGNFVFTTATASASVPSHMQADRPLVPTGGVAPEMVALIDLDEVQGLGKYVYTNTAGSRFKGLVTMEPLARTDDFLPFLIKTYGTTVDAFEATSVMHRGLRVA